MRRLRSHTAISAQPDMRVFDDTILGALVAGIRERYNKAPMVEHRIDDSSDAKPEHAIDAK